MHTFWIFDLEMGSTDEIGASEVVDGVRVLVDKSIALLLLGARSGTSEKVHPFTELSFSLNIELGYIEGATRDDNFLEDDFFSIMLYEASKIPLLKLNVCSLFSSN